WPRRRSDTSRCRPRRPRPSAPGSTHLIHASSGRCMPSRATWTLAGVVAAGLAVASMVAAPGLLATKSGGLSAAKPAPLVSVLRAESRDVPIKLRTQGHVVALAEVDVRPQASGTIRGIHFHEGDTVKVGQLLFTIDASDVAAQLARAEATAAQVEAQVDDAERQLARTQELAKSNF